MNSNQQILDNLLRKRILLLGFSKQLADEVISYLKETEPAIRHLLLKLYGVGGRKLITRLREAESHLRDIRSEAWKKSYDHVVSKLVEMAELESDSLDAAVGEEISLKENENHTALVLGGLIAGQKLKEWFDTMAEADARRAVVQLRLGYLGDATITQVSKSLTGKLSLIQGSAANSVKSVLATSVIVVPDAVRKDVLYTGAMAPDQEIWISVLDNRTTETCRKLDGKVFPVGVGIQPGYHFRCRSIRSPYWDGNGSVKAASYASWIATQPADFRRYAGEDFSFNSLKPLSLDQVFDD